MSTQLADQHLLYKAETDSVGEVGVSTQKSIIVVPDENGNSYSGQISFNAQSQLTGNNKFTSLEDAHVVIPYTATMKISGKIAPDGATTTAGVGFNRFSLTPKFNVASIIDSLTVELNNKTILTEQQFKQYWTNYVLPWTETTQDELAKHGVDRLIHLDDWKSINHTGGTTNAFGGDGYSNNHANRSPSIATAPSLDIDIGAGNSQEPFAFNGGYFRRMLNHAPMVIDATESQATFGWPSFGSKSTKNIVEQTGKSCFKEYPPPARNSTTGDLDTTKTLSEGGSGYVGSWFWLHKIRLADLHPLFKNLPLTANCQLKIKLRINQGKFQVTGVGGDSYNITNSTVVHGSTCPLMLASAFEGNPLQKRIVTGTVIDVAYGAIKNAYSDPTIEGTGYFPFNQARLYIPAYELANPTALISNPVRTVKFLDCYAQMFDKKAGLGVSSSGSQLNAPFNIQASGTYKNVKYCCLLPFPETSSGNYATISNLPDYQSPVSSSPATLHPGSAIRNFQLEIGGQSVFNAVKEYDFSSFRDEVAKLNAINGDLGRFNCGLLSENQWSYANRMLVADVSRYTHEDVPASVVCSGVNASSQGSDLLLLIVYERQIEIDILTGEVLSFN